MPLDDPETLLRALFTAAVAAADPRRVVAAHLPPRPFGRTAVVGAGKAAAAMAAATEAAWGGGGGPTGLVVTRYGHAVPTRTVEVVEAGHPTPDEAGVRAAGRMLELAGALGEDDLLLCLLSGGGSALATLPAPGLSLDELQALNRALLRSGATIGEINCVRRHLSTFSGGRLAAAAWPARTVALAISDTPGDDPHDIASGPTVGDPTTCADALAVLARHGVGAPPAVRARLEDGAGESVKPGDPRLARSELRLIATPQASLEAAARQAGAAGVDAHILSDALEGESREVARVLAALARQVATRGQPFARRPCVLLSGGETTVSVRGEGRGGRNVEFALALALALDGLGGVHALAADTDGVDGSEPVAGAVVGPDTLARARALGLDPRAVLDANDAHSLFEALGDQVVTGPTLTNVNDFRAILIA